jgi:hypothetical protein
MIIATTDLLVRLGFAATDDAMSDTGICYVRDFGNLQLRAIECMTLGGNRVMLSGTLVTPRSLAQINFELPARLASFELGVALMTHYLRDGADLAVPPDWIADGVLWGDLLPWRADRLAYAGRPQCFVELDWFRLAMRKLRSLPEDVPDNDTTTFKFDGSMLDIAGGSGFRLLLPATGTRWASDYRIETRRLRALPKRCTRSAGYVGIWEDRLGIGNFSCALLDAPVGAE